MKELSLEPDPSMRWIYDKKHPAYNDPQTKDLRDRRAAAMRNAPDWMVREAELNDINRKKLEQIP